MFLTTGILRAGGGGRILTFKTEIPGGLARFLLRHRQGCEVLKERACLSVCMLVYLCVRPLAYLKNNCSPSSTNLSARLLGVTAVRSCSDDGELLYVLPVLWMTSRSPTIGKGDANREYILKVTNHRWQHRGRSQMSTIALFLLKSFARKNKV